AWLDADACQRMLELAGRIGRPLADSDALPVNFEANVRRQIDAALTKALEENNTYFQAERERLDQWAEDQLLSAEQALQDTKARLKDAKRRARAATTVEDQAAIQDEIR